MKPVSLNPALQSIAFALTLSAVLMHGSAALGQAFPSKPVRFLSGQPPGGATDFFARMVAQKLNETWKQPVIVEHRPGASGSIALELTVKSPPDGHTLVFSTSGQIVMNPYLMKLTYDPLTDLAPVAFLVHTCMLLITHPSVPARNARELIALAKAQPGKLNVASGGTGATTHPAAEPFMSQTAIRLTHIPYRGGGPSVLAVVTGDAALFLGSVPATMAQARAGR